MDISKIENNVTVDRNGCWNWKGAVSSTGRGNIEENGKQYTAYQYAWECTHGPVPKGKMLRHTCSNPLCCNPAHLKLGTAKDNYHDSKDAHAKADAKRRSTWVIDGIKYDTAKAAVQATGISMNSVVKYTKNGKFDRASYEKACKLAGTYPKEPVKRKGR